MMYRNLCAMDVEEIARANPVDGMVLLVVSDIFVYRATHLYYEDASQSTHQLSQRGVIKRHQPA